MRTTVNIDDDVLAQARSIAHDRQISVGEALSGLARAGMDRAVELEEDPETGLLVLHDPTGRKVTADQVYRLQEEEDVERYRDLMDHLRRSK
jgi:hypothetical protein